jgi:hypothetical protein
VIYHNLIKVKQIYPILEDGYRHAYQIGGEKGGRVEAVRLTLAPHFPVGLGVKGLTPTEKLRKTKTIIHWHIMLVPVLLLETILSHIGSFNQFLKQQKGGKYIYTTCQKTTCTGPYRCLQKYDFIKNYLQNNMRQSYTRT